MSLGEKNFWKATKRGLRNQIEFGGGRAEGRECVLFGGASQPSGRHGRHSRVENRGSTRQGLIFSASGSDFNVSLLTPMASMDLVPWPHTILQ